ncbi:TonB-dependent receptor [Geofilum rubicundum]|uniref:TonB-dependent receptor n=1 Tax=Geofilum rubicundum JCM 15548 TaxID=1236989 RepID=A0A0E9M2U3_9BACT|nr:TonB-dependent receptor [Geofilum rubicundum]GAO31435.1 TonB-dependent receptor [Geofilum rubicundum JCM 15548]
MKQFIIIWLLLLSSMYAMPQSSYHVAGLVVDENNQPMPGCHVKSNGQLTVTDNKGRFIFNHVTKEAFDLEVSAMGYFNADTTLMAQSNHHIRIHMKPDQVQLAEVSVQGNRLKTSANQSRETVSSRELTQQMNGTLVRTLDRQVGFNTMDIGASASKPVIRGMGFNRVVVVSNGIKQEGQQWGADHGLEMDPFLTEQAEIIKGAASIEHGSDAIGGILQLTSNRIPENGLSGSLQMLGKTVNETAGGTLLLQGSNNRLFFKGRATWLDYGDYRIPTDTVLYLTRKIPIHNRQLKNSAGEEQDLYLQAGILGQHWRSSISASRVWQKSGFFPGAHGVPDIDRVQIDHSSRNIDFPYQNVEHWSVTSNTMIQTPHSAISFDLGYQQNHRQEWSEFHTHYSNQLPPETDPDLELDFDLKTWSGNARWNFRLTPQHAFTLGGQFQWQKNFSAGYSFLLPEFERTSTGTYLKHDYTISEKWQLNAGFRYDLVHLNTSGFYDPILYDYMLSTGSNEASAQNYARRATAVDRTLDDYSWIAGARFVASKRLSLALNMGESFRAPTPNELTTNGIHHGSFRHEVGDPTLGSERGFYLDAVMDYDWDDRKITLSPYYYHFSNYLFLNPTGEWSQLPHAGQIYRFTQSEAAMMGIELGYSDIIGIYWEYELNGEYIHNYQKNTANYPLPFSPPANAFAELTYIFQPHLEAQSIRISLHGKLTARQNRIARNEVPTPGYALLGAAIFIPVKLGNIPAELNLQAHNLFNTRYYNHISFYRKLEIPEPGRNVQLLINIPF